MAIKAIIMDLDRTLLHTDKTLSPFSLRTLNRCRERGLFLMLATARPLRTVVPFLKQLSFDAWTVMNGAKVICGEKSAAYEISQESALFVLAALCAMPGLPLSVEVGDRVFSNQEIPEYDSIIEKNLLRVAKEETVYKLLATYTGPETLRQVEAALPGDLYATVAHGSLIQIMSRKATKWNGIKTMAAMKGINPEEVMYFGDDYDDLEAILHCGWGVAVHNAIEQVRRAAKAIAPCNDQDGVARYLQAYFHLKDEEHS